jgi:NAD+ synthase (glutamine-hydrolysing)
MLKDIGHPYAEGQEDYDVTFENVQAGERTSHLFRLANLHGGMVVGTGDLSELALGWATYGVGVRACGARNGRSAPTLSRTSPVRRGAPAGSGQAGTRTIRNRNG